MHPGSSQLCLRVQTEPPDWTRESNRGSQNEGTQNEGTQAYPEVDIDIPTSTKLPVTNLEGHGHQIILVQVLVEALS